MKGQSSAVRRVLSLTKNKGFKAPYPRMGPFPMADTCGHGIALAMVLDSLNPGVYSKDYKQFATIRHMKHAFGNVWDTSVRVGAGRTFGFASEDKKRMMEITNSPTQSRWFRRFMIGCKKRMGEDYRPDLALHVDIVVAMIDVLERRVHELRGEEQKQCIAIATYIVIGFAASLRGNEGFMMDLAGIRSMIYKGKAEGELGHVLVALLGRFKGEDGERYHIIPLANETGRSHIPVRKWIERLISMRAMEGRTNGPAFCDKDGRVARSTDYEELMHDVLRQVQDERPDLIPPDMDVIDVYGISRSLRQGSNTTAINNKVSPGDQDAINRWATVEAAQGRRPNFMMRDLYLWRWCRCCPPCFGIQGHSNGGHRDNGNPLLS